MKNCRQDLPALERDRKGTSTLWSLGIQDVYWNGSAMATLNSTWKATAWIFMFWSPHLRHLPWYVLDQANCMDLPLSKTLSKKASSVVCPKYVMFTLNCTCPSIWIFDDIPSLVDDLHVRQSGVVVTVFVEAKHLAESWAVLDHNGAANRWFAKLSWTPRT